MLYADSDNFISIDPLNYAAHLMQVKYFFYSKKVQYMDIR